MLAANNYIICCCLKLTKVEILSDRLCFQWKWKHYSMLIQTKISLTDCWTVLLLDYRNYKCPNVYQSNHCCTITMESNKTTKKSSSKLKKCYFCNLLNNCECYLFPNMEKDNFVYTNNVWANTFWSKKMRKLTLIEPKIFFLLLIRSICKWRNSWQWHFNLYLLTDPV